ncbi:hypothetical protein BDQ17DRAFT_679476 [Cyathus striatus]|nr:hypothetical protein BDQ17DRAFT_679476 [Cyathus striatus]
MAFHGAHSFIINGNINAVDHSRQQGDSQLEYLANAACLAAGHQSEERHDAPKCHPETRKAVIDDIMNWVDSMDPNKRIMWLQGAAGAGKSSIAQTVAERCSEENKLISAFFFSRTATGTGRDDGTRLVPTIAYQLAISVPLTADLITSEFVKDKAILSYSMEVQMKNLVIKPLKEVNECHALPHVPYLVIIDGLDECKKPEMQSRILDMIAKSVRQLSVPLYFLISCRPELEIRTAFNNMLLRHLHNQVTLDNRYNPENDIYTFIRSEFEKIKLVHPLASTLSNLNWPSEPDLKCLVKRATGQFIYPSTVMNYVQDIRHDPRDRLLTVINIKLGEASPYTELDTLYKHIICTAVAKANGYENIQRVFQALIYMEFSSLTHVPFMLAAFLQMSESTLRLQLVDLHSIIYVPSLELSEENRTQSHIQFFHASFSDFLKDPSRSEHFYISKKVANVVLGRFCLELILNNDIPDIQAYVLDGNEDSEYSYAYHKFLFHLRDSEFEVELINRILLNGREKVHKIMMDLIETPVCGFGITYYSMLCHFLKFNLSADYIFESAVPLHEDLTRICRHIIDAANDWFHICISEDINGELHLRAISTMNEKTSSQSLSNIDNIYMDFRFIGEILDSPMRGRNHFLSDERCQQLFHILWDRLIKKNFTPFVFNGIQHETHCYYSLYASGFEYLIKKIKPSIMFEQFLHWDVMQRFDETFYNTQGSHSKGLDRVDKCVTSLKSSIQDYLNRMQMEVS